MVGAAYFSNPKVGWIRPREGRSMARSAAMEDRMQLDLFLPVLL